MSSTTGERLAELSKAWSVQHGKAFTAQAAARGMSLAQVAARAGVSGHQAESLGRGRSTDTGSFGALIKEVGYDPDRSAPDLSEVCEGWSDEHGSVLLAAVKAAGHQRLDDFASATGISKMSMWRWTTNRVRPRAASLAPVLAALGVDETIFAGASGTRVGEEKNRFASELARLLAENELSVSRGAQALGVSASALAGWLEGRALPRDPEVRARLEHALGVSVKEVKDEAELSSTTTAGLTGLGELVVKRRLALGMTRKDLAEAVNATEDTVRGWEVDSMTPPHSYLRELARALQVSREEVAVALFGELPGSDFHERLRRARKHQLMTTNEVAHALGFKNQHAYTRYEAGPDSKRSTSFPGSSERLSAIAEVIGVEVEELLEPDHGVFASWLTSILTGAGAAALAKASKDTGANVAEIMTWANGTKRPSVRQAELIGMALGTGKVVARAALTGERVL